MYICDDIYKRGKKKKNHWGRHDREIGGCLSVWVPRKLLG